MNIEILQGDCIESLKKLEDQSINTCITSPPYWGLRDYGTAEWIGGDENCDHLEKISGMSDKNTLGPNKHLPNTNQANISGKIQYKNVCAKCGAVRKDSQLGLEDTPEEFVENLVNVFREVKRVLRDDGTVWLNLGDSYISGKSRYSTKEQTLAGGGENQKKYGSLHKGGKKDMYGHPFYKDKDLAGIPWRVALALQQDGWYLRQDIIWHKPNPMPESVKDRCTKAHEYIFLLSKNKKYYCDMDSIREPIKESNKGFIMARARTSSGALGGKNKHNMERRDYKEIKGANKRSVWTVTTKPFKGAHFATFPKDLIEPCVLAGCPEGGTVLDPFGGSGTTGIVAAQHNRNAVLLELNQEYIDLAKDRINKELGMFGQGVQND